MNPAIIFSSYAFLSAVNKGYIFGGENGRGGSAINSLYSSNGIAGSWSGPISYPGGPTCTGSDITARTSQACAADSTGSLVICYGGTSKAIGYAGIAELNIYQGSTGCWTTFSSSTPGGIVGACMARGADNAYYIFGGATDDSTAPGLSTLWQLVLANEGSGNPPTAGDITWTNIAYSTGGTGAVSGVEYPACAYDSSRNVLYAFGGYVSTISGTPYDTNQLLAIDLRLHRINVTLPSGTSYSPPVQQDGVMTIYGDQLVVYGGWLIPTNGRTSDIYVYSRNESRWISVFVASVSNVVNSTSPGLGDTVTVNGWGFVNVGGSGGQEYLNVTVNSVGGTIPCTILSSNFSTIVCMTTTPVTGPWLNVTIKNGSNNVVDYYNFGMGIRTLVTTTTSTTTSMTTTTSTTTTSTTALATSTTTSTTSTSTSTTAPLQSTSAPSPISYLTIIIVVVGVVAILFVGLVAAILYRRRQRVAKTMDSDIKREIVKGHGEPNLKSDGMNLNTAVDQTTAALRQNFALPGHLQMSLNEEIRVIKALAAGGGGEVKLAEMLSSSRAAIGTEGKTVILKLMRTDKNVDELSLKAIWQQEISILWSFHTHPNIARLLGYTEIPLGMVLKLYLCSLNDVIHLRDHPHSRSIFTYQGMYRLAIDIATGMAALHAASVLHFDLKPENVLLELKDDKSYNAVITDFGISRIVGVPNVRGRIESNIRGLSLKYASPELFAVTEMQGYEITMMDAVVDIFAFSILLWEMLERKVPWDGLSREDIKKSVIQGERPRISQELKETENPLVSSLLDIMQKGWAHNPSQRPSFEGIVKALQLCIKEMGI